MKFYEWIIEKYLGKNNPQGDLAGDMARDFYTGPNTRKAILAHLNRCAAITECIEVFEECWQEYASDLGRKRASTVGFAPPHKPLIGAWSDSKDQSFLDLERSEQDRVLAWIRQSLKVPLKWRTHYSSYYLKHLLQRNTGIYVSNGQFKDAMILAGFKPVNARQLNHRYWLHPKSPALDPDRTAQGWRYLSRDSAE
ncbi:hypothetical protein I4J37_06525 [Corynebacterium belfantii]|uniref:YozE family protein n=1 Tax=Corynebacterium belfantii TaxID=2014537 RepID=UPI0018D47FB8|nr:YozE family protein [Corynebacterium belfantii]MBG9319425.1 hypothetical protein [Corynebacterium belfantii]